jgi:predicted metal-dependent hydrolase
VRKKSAQIAALVEEFQGRELDAHYLSYFECFNRQRFYEAHDVLETLWLAQRHGGNGLFFKGLIQLAGAFVHLQKNRLQPAARLFKLARTNLRGYPGTHERLDVDAVLAMIEQWLDQLESGGLAANPLSAATAPELRLKPCLGPATGAHDS